MRISRKELNRAEDSRVYKLKARVKQKCPICAPNKGENAKRKATHGKTKPKYKDKR